ncbi:MAG TPA: zinc ribbon-containing protein [Methylophilaceae bacterium]|nr:zinc ribbon-containing protein [Methylophilaceae bacterium]
MKPIPPKTEVVEKMSEAYQVLLKTAVHKAHQSDTMFHHMIDEVKEDIAGLSRLSRDEAFLLKEYIKRDLRDAAEYMQTTRRELKDWLGFDLELLEREFWQNFSEAADKTSIELMQLKEEAEFSTYLTGEVTGAGTLVCDHCGERVNFDVPGRIPPCPECHNTHFHRQHFE